ncbi:MAG: MFS transporter [Lachnospiraceae bacterium]|nr:MFS transporter [Lachnospiraceae bacterium]
MGEKAQGGWRTNKWVRAAIPALLLHCSIGTVYCWSVFSQEIADYIGHSKSSVEWAFSFAIFFLGMSAAFLGNVVERDIHRSSLIATICFSAGMILTGCLIYYGGSHKGSMAVLIGIFISYGFIMGVGLGTGYLSPVKTLMLWFKDNKGLATGLAVAGFGAAKAIASPIMTSILNASEGGVYKMFWILGAVYFVMMFCGHLLLAKPADWHEPSSGEKTLSTWDVIKSKPISNYIGIWAMFYINITCGLALISQEKPIVKCIGLVGFAGIIASVSAIFNAGGRLGFSAWADYQKDRNTIYKIIFALSILFTALVMVTGGIKNGYGNGLLIALVLCLIMVVNAGYGGGFSNVPTLLSDHYGMGSISAIHGITLSAWAFAGLTGNQIATFIVNHTGEFIDVDGYSVNPQGYQNVLYFTIIMYIIAMALCMILVRPSGKAAAEKAAAEKAKG